MKALRTGEPSATELAGQYLADDVVLATGQDEVAGHDNVLKRITGQWAFFTQVMHNVAFSEIYYWAVLINTEDGRRTAVKPITAKAGWEWSQFLMQSSRVRKP